jgi:hypothetical protein
MVQQGVYQHQATCHLPSLSSQLRSSSHVLQRRNITIRLKVKINYLSIIKFFVVQLCKNVWIKHAEGSI